MSSTNRSYLALGSEPAKGVGHHPEKPSGAAEEIANTTSASSNYGPHSTNAGNKLDPRIDSDTDHRGTATNSTNAGHHTSNLANQLDPRIDSDRDHRANPTSAVGPSDTLTGSTGSSNVGNHRSNFANKLDPKFDSDADHRANPASNVGGPGAGY